MKNLFLAALAVLTLGVATIPAYAAGPDDGLNSATTMQQQAPFTGGGAG